MKSWLVSLNSAGQGCWFCKLDWSGARVVTQNQFQFGGGLRKHHFQRSGPIALQIRGILFHWLILSKVNVKAQIFASIEVSTVKEFGTY